MWSQYRSLIIFYRYLKQCIWHNNWVPRDSSFTEIIKKQIKKVENIYQYYYLIQFLPAAPNNIYCSNNESNEKKVNEKMFFSQIIFNFRSSQSVESITYLTFLKLRSNAMNLLIIWVHHIRTKFKKSGS